MRSPESTAKKTEQLTLPTVEEYFQEAYDLKRIAATYIAELQALAVGTPQEESELHTLRHEYQSIQKRYNELIAILDVLMKVQDTPEYGNVHRSAYKKWQALDAAVARTGDRYNALVDKQAAGDSKDVKTLTESVTPSPEAVAPISTSSKRHAERAEEIASVRQMLSSELLDAEMGAYEHGLVKDARNNSFKSLHGRTPKKQYVFKKRSGKQATTATNSNGKSTAVGGDTMQDMPVENPAAVPKVESGNTRSAEFQFEQAANLPTFPDDIAKVLRYGVQRGQHVEQARALQHRSTYLSLRKSISTDYEKYKTDPSPELQARIEKKLQTAAFKYKETMREYEYYKEHDQTDTTEDIGPKTTSERFSDDGQTQAAERELRFKTTPEPANESWLNDLDKQNAAVRGESTTESAAQKQSSQTTPYVSFNINNITGGNNAPVGNSVEGDVTNQTHINTPASETTPSTEEIETSPQPADEEHESDDVVSPRPSQAPTAAYTPDEAVTLVDSLDTPEDESTQAVVPDPTLAYTPEEAEALAGTVDTVNGEVLHNPDAHESFAAVRDARQEFMHAKQVYFSLLERKHKNPENADIASQLETARENLSVARRRRFSAVEQARLNHHVWKNSETLKKHPLHADKPESLQPEVVKARMVNALALAIAETRAHYEVAEIAQNASKLKALNWVKERLQSGGEWARNNKVKVAVGLTVLTAGGWLLRKGVSSGAEQAGTALGGAQAGAVSGQVALSILSTAALGGWIGRGVGAAIGKGNEKIRARGAQKEVDAARATFAADTIDVLENAFVNVDTTAAKSEIFTKRAKTVGTVAGAFGGALWGADFDGAGNEVADVVNDAEQTEDVLQSLESEEVMSTIQPVPRPDTLGQTPAPAPEVMAEGPKAPMGQMPEAYPSDVGDLDSDGFQDFEQLQPNVSPLETPGEPDPAPETVPPKPGITEQPSESMSESMDEPVAEAEVESIPTIDLETLVHTVQPGDQGVTYILQEHYPDLFPPVGSPDWLPIYSALTSDPELLEAAGFPNANLDLIRPGEQFRADVFAEYYLNEVADEATREAYLANHPELVTAMSPSASVETGPPVEATAAPKESLRPEPRPADLTATEYAPTDSPRPVPNPGATTADAVTPASPEIPVAPETNLNTPELNKDGTKNVFAQEVVEGGDSAPEAMSLPELQQAVTGATTEAQNTYRDVAEQISNRFDISSPGLAADIQREVSDWAQEVGVGNLASERGVPVETLLQERAASLYLRELLPVLMPSETPVETIDGIHQALNRLWDVPLQDYDAAAATSEHAAIQAVQGRLNQMGAQPFSSFNGTVGEFLQAVYASTASNPDAFRSALETLQTNP